MNSKTILFFLFTMFAQNLMYAQIQTIFSPEQLERLNDIAVQDVPKAAPGIATGIVQNGKIIYKKTAGFANLADSMLITDSTRFNIASNGKQFTALAILVLADEQKIRLTDDIRKYLPGLYPKIASTITIENLLNHTSGVRDVYDLWSLQGLTWWQQSFNNNDVLALIEKQQELNFKPGTKHLYSNSNYILLALLVEKVTGNSFVAFTNGLFKKLNMPHTCFENDYTNIRGSIAKAYFNFKTWTTYNWVWNVCGDGNIFSTLADQLEWEQVLQGKKQTGIKWRVLQKSQQLTDHSTIKNYGYGLELGTYKGLSYSFHEGATGAWKATVIRFPGKKTAFVTLTNTGKCTPDKQTRQMADVVFNVQEDAKYFITQPVKAGNFVSDEDMTGTYQTDNNFTFQFEKRDSIVYLKRIGRNDVALEREAANILHQTFDHDFKQEFKRNAKGEMEVTAYYTSHAPYTLKKVNSNLEGFNYRALDGKYLNAETNVTLEMKYRDDKNYEVIVAKTDSTQGLLISPGKLLVDNYTVEIEKSTGVPKTLLLSGGRIEKVRFRRVE